MIEERKPNCVHVAEETWKQVKAIKTKRVQESITEIDFVKTLENIKKHCRDTACLNCEFSNKGRCQIVTFFEKLAATPPVFWEMYKIKEILDE